MKILYLTLCMALQILGSELFAQAYPSQQKTADQEISAHVSAMGAFIYPGAKAGIDYMVINKTIQQSGSNGVIKTITKNKFITANIGFYHHRDYNTNLLLQAGYQFQRMNSNGWFRSFEPQIGISRTFIDGAVYKVNDDHTVTRKKGAGHFYLSPALSFGLVKTFPCNILIFLYHYLQRPRSSPICHITILSIPGSSVKWVSVGIQTYSGTSVMSKNKIQ